MSSRCDRAPPHVRAPQTHDAPALHTRRRGRRSEETQRRIVEAAVKLHEELGPAEMMADFLAMLADADAAADG
ncbi:MAG: hypothetical protein ACOC8B_07215 [Gemmatimonadota bacterium]